MKSGYDQFFKVAQGVANTGDKKSPASKASSKSRFSFSADAPQSRAQQSDSRYQKRNTLPKDSKKIAEELRLRMQSQQKTEALLKKKKRKKVSWKMASMSFLGLIFSIGVVWKFEKIEPMLKKVEISILGTVYAEDKPVKDDKNKEGKGEAKDSAGKEGAAKDEKAAAEKKETKKEFSEEDINHFSKLNDRKLELDAREEELNKVEQELAAQKAELEKRMKELEDTRQNISKVLEEKVQIDEKKVDNLVQLYSSMKPQQAAKAFEEMDESLAIEILGRMKKKSAAEIMNLVKAEKVKVFSEKYAGYKRN